MCFDYDPDWFAEIIKEDLLSNGDKCTCGECGSIIEENEPRTKVFMRERETCEICYDLDAECDHDYGESFDIQFCEGCRKIIAAICEYEKREGCPANSQRPAYGLLWDELSQHCQASEYLAFAAEMFPEVKDSKIYKTFA